MKTQNDLYLTNETEREYAKNKYHERAELAATLSKLAGVPILPKDITPILDIFREQHRGKVRARVWNRFYLKKLGDENLALLALAEINAVRALFRKKQYSRDDARAGKIPHETLSWAVRAAVFAAVRRTCAKPGNTDCHLIRKASELIDELGI